MKKILGFAFGPLAGAVLSLVAVPLSTWVFSPADIGRLNVLQITLSFILLLSVLGLDQAFVREFHEVEHRPALLRACFAPGFLFLLLSGGFFILFSAPLSKWLYGSSSTWWYVGTLLCAVLAFASRYLGLVLRMQERGWAYSFSQVLPKALQLILFFILTQTAFNKNFGHLLLVTLASSTLVFLIYAWNTRNDWLLALQSNIDFAQLQGLLKFGIPLVLASLAYWGVSATSTIALRSLSTLDELAVYAVGNNFAGAAFVFQSIFSVLWAPTVYKWSAQGANMHAVDKIAQQVLAAVCVIAALSAMSAGLADYFLPAHYADVKNILLCMMMQPLLYTLSEVTAVGIGIQRRTELAIWVALAALATNAALSYGLVPRFGAIGAAVANATAFTVFFIARTEASARVWRDFSRRRLYSVVGLLWVLAVLAATRGEEKLSPIAHLF